MKKYKLIDYNLTNIINIKPLIHCINCYKIMENNKCRQCHYHAKYSICDKTIKYQYNIAKYEILKNLNNKNCQ